MAIVDESPSGRNYTANELAYLRREMDKHREEAMKALQDKVIGIETCFYKEMNSLEDKLKINCVRCEEELINRTVNKAIEQVFEMLEVNIHDPADVKRFRDDLRFGGLFRNATTKGFFAILATLCGGIGLSVWLAIKEKIGIP